MPERCIPRTRRAGRAGVWSDVMKRGEPLAGSGRAAGSGAGAPCRTWLRGRAARVVLRLWTATRLLQAGAGGACSFRQAVGPENNEIRLRFQREWLFRGGGAPSPSRLRCPKRPSESPRQAGEGQGRPPASGGPDLSSPACRRSSRSPHAGGPEPDTVRRADCGWRDGGDPARPAAPEPDAPCRRAVRKCPAPGGGGSARSGHRPFTLSALACGGRSCAEGVFHVRRLADPVASLHPAFPGAETCDPQRGAAAARCAGPARRARPRPLRAARRPGRGGRGIWWARAPKGPGQGGRRPLRSGTRRRRSGVSSPRSRAGRPSCWPRERGSSSPPRAGAR